MFLKTNDEITYLGNIYLFNGFSNIRNLTSLNIDLINSLTYSSISGSFTLSIMYGKVDNFKITVSGKNVVIIGKDENNLTLALYYVNSLFHPRQTFSNQTITDHPKYSHREFCLDVARNYISIEEIKKIINELAYNRINYLHLHLSDDQNFAIKSDQYPLLNTKQQYTKSEIRDLVQYARTRGIEIIPEIDIPGHMTHILNAYPNLRCNNDTSTNVMCLKPENLVFIFSLIDEVSELFPGQYFHFGCDELDLRNNKKCKNCCKNDEKTVEKFINAVAQHILGLGKKPIVWNDALRYGTLNKEIIIQKWIDYHKDTRSLAEYESGRKFIMGSTLDTYFDYPYSLIPLKKTYEYSPTIKGKDATEILGISSHIWCEHIDNNVELEKNIFPRIQAFGENAWVNSLDYKDFLKRLKNEMKKFESRDISCTDLYDADNVDYRKIVNYLYMKTNMTTYSKPNYFEIANLTLDLLRNTQNSFQITRDIVCLIRKKIE